MQKSPRRKEADRKSKQWAFCATKGTEASKSDWRWVSGTERARMSKERLHDSGRF